MAARYTRRLLAVTRPFLGAASASALAAAAFSAAALAAAVRSAAAFSEAAFIAATRSLVGGYYLIPPFGKYELAVELTRYILEGDR